METAKSRRTTHQSHSRRTGRTIRATGLAATATLAGALTMAATAPSAAADASTPVTLSSSDSLQPVIDQVLAATQQAAAMDATLPFATPNNLALLPDVLQAMQFHSLMQTLHSLYPSQPLYLIPGDITQNAAPVRAFPFLYTPQNFYWTSNTLDPNATWVLTGDYNEESAKLLINLSAQTVSGQETLGSLTQDNVVVNADGTYTVYISPTKPDGALNWLDSTGSNTLAIKSVMADFAAGPSTAHLDCIADCPAEIPGLTSTGASPSAIQTVLHGMLQTTQLNNFGMTHLAIDGGVMEPDNTMAELQPSNILGASGDADTQSTVTSSGNWDLQPDQAMIVKLPTADSMTNSMVLYNSWGQSLPSPFTQMSLNGAQSFHSSDGFTYYVVSGTNPGVANWLDTGGLAQGSIVSFVTGGSHDGESVTTEVVPLSDVHEYLPADFPTVSPAEYAADMTARVLGYNYALDTVRTSDGGSNWITEQLWLRDIEAAMGSDNFQQLFGENPSSPMWLRLTPALSPDWTTVAKDFLTNPSGSFSAFADHLSMAQDDIALPIKLTATLLQQNFTETFEALQTALAAGDLQQALTALTDGGQQFGTILSDALFDPSISITAGILNARDDLATAVMYANGGFPDELGPLATWQWEHMSELTQLTADSWPADILGLFD